MRFARFIPLLIILATGCGREEDTLPAEPPRDIMLATSGNRATPIDLPAPEASFALLDGRTVTLRDFSGQPLVVNFWATWCGPCVEEMPMLSALRDSLSSVEVVGISLAEPDTAGVRAFMATKPVSYPIGVDPDASFGDALGGVYAMPTSFFVDAEGIIRFRVTGAITRDEALDLIERVSGD